MPSAEIPQFLRREAGIERMTERKWEVLGCVANGMTAEETAVRLNISAYTVENHLDQICEWATLCDGDYRVAVLTPLIIEGVKTRRIVVEDVPDDVRLTRRELDVKKSLLSGLCVSGVAHELAISVKTVESHRTHLYRKLGARNHYHAVGKITTYESNKLEKIPQILKTAPQLVEAVL